MTQPDTERSTYRRAAFQVLLLALALGLGETLWGLLAGSSFLTRDGLAWGYGVTIYAIGLAAYGRSTLAEVRGGYASAAVLAIGGCHGLYELLTSLLRREPDDGLANLSTSAAISLAGAALSALILARFRRSVDPVVSASWLSARNDIVTSLLDAGVVLATAATGFRWLDQVSTGIGVVLSYWAAVVVARDARALRAAIGRPDGA